MGLFSKKPKKTPEQLKAEREVKVKQTSDNLKLQIMTLEKKQNAVLAKVMEARRNGLPEQEQQARTLLKRIMAYSKRAKGMLMTLELSMQSRDIAQLNSDFLQSVSILSDDIISSANETSKVQAKKVEDKFLKAVYTANKQNEQMDEMLAMGEYAGTIGVDTGMYSEFDKEIDSMLDGMPMQGVTPNTRMKF